MPKLATTVSLTLPPRPPGVTATRWLYQALRGAILDGQLRPGRRIPSTRDLGNEYGLARGTLVAVFDRLKAEGYLEARVGAGTFVAKVLPAGRRAVPTRARAAAGSVRPISDFARRLRPFERIAEGPVLAFQSNRPALDRFPVALWARVASRRLRRATASQLIGCEPAGYGPLREAIADYLTASRGVACGADQVLVVSGAQEALGLVARLVLNRGELVAMEDPGYIGAALVFEASGARLVPIPVDGEGMTLAPELTGARLVYVTPAHQFPLGVSMGLARRLALLEWAHASGALVLEDDYDSEYRYEGRPLPALQGLDRHGQVLFVGSFSKVLYPSLRLGYLVVPPDMVDAFAALVSITARHAPLLDQAILADFIGEGHFGRHLRRMREVYAERLGTLVAAARSRLAGRLEISGIEAGLQTVGWLAPGLEEAAVVRAAARHGVEVVPLGRYRRGAPIRPGLQLGFAGVAPPEIRRGVDTLAVALDEVARAPRRARR